MHLLSTKACKPEPETVTPPCAVLHGASASDSWLNLKLWLPCDGSSSLTVTAPVPHMISEGCQGSSSRYSLIMTPGPCSGFKFNLKLNKKSQHSLAPHFESLVTLTWKLEVVQWVA